MRQGPGKVQESGEGTARACVVNGTAIQEVRRARAGLSLRPSVHLHRQPSFSCPFLLVQHYSDFLSRQPPYRGLPETDTPCQAEIRDWLLEPEVCLYILVMLLYSNPLIFA